MINGSPRRNSNSYTALKETESIFAKNNIDCEIMHIGADNIHGCKACFACGNLGKCISDDAVNTAAAKFKEADALLYTMD